MVTTRSIVNRDTKGPNEQSGNTKQSQGRKDEVPPNKRKGKVEEPTDPSGTNKQLEGRKVEVPPIKKRRKADEPNEQSGTTKHSQGRTVKVPHNKKERKAAEPNRHSGTTKQSKGRKAEVTTQPTSLKEQLVDTSEPAEPSEMAPTSTQPSSYEADSDYNPSPTLSDGAKEGSLDLHGREGATQKQRCVVQPKRQKTNVACRVEHYLAVVRAFSARKKRIVRQMGLENLLDFDVTRLNRRFCMWLYRQFDPVKCVLVLDREGQETIPVKPNQVSWVLGVPMDGKVVPKERKQLNALGKAQVDMMKEKFGFQKEIPTQPVLDELRRDDVPDADFRRAFLLFILGNLLCPTQSTGISPELLPAATVALSCARYAWGQFIHEWLCKCGRRFHKDMDKVAGPQGAGGCALVLMVLYLDRKPLPGGVNFYRTPRLLAWSDDAVEEAIASDMIDADTYGKAMVLQGVSYGHPHPSEGLDMPWGSPLGLQWFSMSSAPRYSSWQKEPSVYRPNREIKRKHNARHSPPSGPASDQMDPQSEARPTEGDAHGGPCNIGQVNTEDTTYDIHDDAPICHAYKRSRPRRKRIPPHQNKDYLYLPVHKQGTTFDQRRVLTYISRSQESSETVFQMGGMFCTLTEVRAAVVQRVNIDSNFIRGVSVWLNTHWNDPSRKTSPRYILDPSFMQAAITGRLEDGVRVEDYDVGLPSFLNKLGKHAATLKKHTDWQQCSIIFLPCCLQYHWFCFAFNLRDKRIEVLDSIKSAEEYEQSGVKEAVVTGFKLLMSHLDNSFDMDGWEYCDAGVPNQPDGHSCGHYMVIAISLWNGNWACIKSELQSYFQDGLGSLVAHMLHDHGNEVRDDLLKRARIFCGPH